MADRYYGSYWFININLSVSIIINEGIPPTRHIYAALSLVFLMRLHAIGKICVSFLRRQYCTWNGFVGLYITAGAVRILGRIKYKKQKGSERESERERERGDGGEIRAQLIPEKKRRGLVKG